jgi:hypothetical protein
VAVHIKAIELYFVAVHDLSITLRTVSDAAFFIDIEFWFHLISSSAMLPPTTL